MRFADEISNEIWGSPQFQSDLRHLFSTKFESEIRRTSSASFDKDAVRRLMQSAFVMADSENESYRDTAQKISTGVFQLLGEQDDATTEMFKAIQSRLKNFPMLRVAESISIPSFPLSLQYEFVRSIDEQTVKIQGDGTEVLTPYQMQAWKLLNRGGSLALSAPTSAGKSFVLLLHIATRFHDPSMTAAAYIVPTRALINQVAEDFVDTFSKVGLANVSVTTVPVDMGGLGREKTLYVLTQERLDVLLISNPSFHLDVVAVDEAQTISSDARGVLLESVLDRIISANPFAQFIFSGPQIENPDSFGRTFGIAGFQKCATTSSPVTQNIIFLDYHERPGSSVTVYLRDEERATRGPELTSLELPIRLLTDIDKISYLSFYFGRAGSSIVYSAGKADAEKVAIKIANEMPIPDAPAESISDLIAFTKRHVHKDYALVETLKKGVGFHYGDMPSLLRKALEDEFRARRLPFLVCTSTLLYGLNLPAKNMFLFKPKTGRETPISGPDFWNLAGRVGRLGKELEGNVYLIDYESWENRPANAPKALFVRSSLGSILIDRPGDLIRFAQERNQSSEKEPALEMALGKLVVDYRQGLLARTISRYKEPQNEADLAKLVVLVDRVSADIDIPLDVLTRNLGVSVFRQKELLDYLIRRAGEIDPAELIPAHPLTEFSEARLNYIRAFKRIHTYLLHYPSKDRRHHFLSGLALRWMRGDPLAVLIDAAIKHAARTEGGRSKAEIIRSTMEDVERELRFRYVKFFTCYNSILELALERSGKAGYIQSIPNLPLFLEMGGASGTMINLMALGLSRTSAGDLVDYITNKEMTVNEVRAWLKGRNFEALDISPICLKEIETLVNKEAF